MLASGDRYSEVNEKQKSQPGPGTFRGFYSLAEASQARGGYLANSEMCQPRGRSSASMIDRRLGVQVLGSCLTGRGSRWE